MVFSGATGQKWQKRALAALFVLAAAVPAPVLAQAPAVKPSAPAAPQSVCVPPPGADLARNITKRNIPYGEYILFRAGALTAQGRDESPVLAIHPLSNRLTREEFVPLPDGGVRLEHYDTRSGNKIGDVYLDSSGMLHRQGGPAYRFADWQTGSVLFEGYFKHGKLDRADGPAWQARDSVTGVLVRNEYWLNGKAHRENAAAVEERYADNGQLKYSGYYCEGYNHNLNGPAALSFFHDGRLQMENWRERGMDYRAKAAATKIYSEKTGRLIIEATVSDNRFERPARYSRTVVYDEYTGRITGYMEHRNGLLVRGTYRLAQPKP